MGDERVVDELGGEGIGRGCGDDGFVEVEKGGGAGGGVSGKRGRGDGGRGGVCVGVRLVMVGC